ncbi:MAG: hypothetical protein MUF67_01550, partial [Desulfobacterales bacterium]|nr:hypothetical protein [Desulfobacterales bacterium]
MEAALSLATRGYPATLLEKGPALGGHGLELHAAWDGQPVAPYLNDLIGRVQNHRDIEVLLNAEVQE